MSKLARSKGFTGQIELLLNKEHYIIYKGIQTTFHYLIHTNEITQKSPIMPLLKQMLIMDIYKNEVKFNEESSLPMTIFRKFLKINYFEEIKAYKNFNHNKI